MWPIKQSTAITVPFFVHDVSGDAVTGLVDAGFTKRISKGAAAFGAMTVTITEMENGWYSFPLSTAHSDALGLLTIVFTNGGAKQVNLQARVSVRLPDDLAFPATSGRSMQVETDGMVHGDLKEWLGVAPLALVSQRVNTSVGAMAANVLTAAAIATGALDGKGDWNIGKAGYSLAATGLDLVTSTAVGAVALAKAVWDTVLGGAFNIVNSAGRRLRVLQESGTYANGAVWIDTVNGTAGTTPFENGVNITPVNNIADANTIATSNPPNLSRFELAPNSSFTFVATQQNQTFVGQNWTVALGGQEIGGTHLFGGNVSGIGTCATEAHFDHMELGNMTIGEAHFDLCDINGTVTLSAATTYLFQDCRHGGAAVIDFGAAVLNTTAHIHAYAGNLTIENLGAAGSDTLLFDSTGSVLTLAASCVGGTVRIKGVVFLVNNGSGITIIRDGDVVNDVALVQADTDDIQTRLPGTLDGGRMRSILDGTGMSDAAVDAILTRQMTESYAANGVAPTLAQAQFAKHQMLMQFGIVGTSYTVRRLDDSTTAFIVTLDDAASPTDAKRV